MKNTNLMDETIKIASDLIRVNSVNPAFGGVGEKEKADYVLNKLNEYIKEYNVKNYSVKHYTIKDDKGIIRPNIVAKFDFGKDRTLHIISHLDTVPEGDINLWDTNPYEPVIKNGNIYGRGSEDNHKGIVSSLLLLKMIFDNKDKFCPKYNLSLIFVSDEESGSNYGIQHILKYEKEIFNKNDLIIVPDFGTPDGNYIEIAEKNILWIKFKIKGKQCHGSAPNHGINADILAFNFANNLYNILYNKYTKRDNLFSPPYSTFEPTMIFNNVENVNTIPGYVELCFDCRILPDYNVEEILKDINEFIILFKDNINKYLKYYDRGEEKHITIEYEILQKELSQKTPENSEIIVELGNAIKKVLNKEPILCGMGGGTVGAFLRAKNYDTVVWGIGEETAHQPNEHIKLNDLINMAKIYYEILKENK
ncbi:M20 family metallo-hydrolase [Methanothermococcus okinawensis]|uniref:Acetylornithine deacetylase or succinyl-diaminopimelate desuccinylase n=1 Tax=Methanothermococcus okinawensis (strain DSM 14208 / JCM 11175 / IH1) TaxID=647113 RepID=F8AKS5_METOI|nr:M20 family metallo-hydrolase [Methanothermococcus okinawensis]AEH06417.1 acetylornithine deacetylase or succinyl-diaminopimelate desuccinylase [Methanothermococcus okinawensis IH1]